MIAIILCTYNGARFLSLQIESILAQTNEEWHLYVHDDGSMDETVTILDNYKRAHPKKITILNYPPIGNACLNFMSCLERIKADYYMFCDQDDIWHSNKIEVTMKAMQEHEEHNPGLPIIVHCDLRMVDDSDNLIAPSFWQYSHLHINSVKSFEDNVTHTATGCAMMFNRKSAECALQKNYSKATMHDIWVVLCTMAAGGIVLPIRQSLIDYRQHESNTVGAIDYNRLSSIYRLLHLMHILKESYLHFRMMNSAGHISIPVFIKKKKKYLIRQ